jgi:hypothetical protein
MKKLWKAIKYLATNLPVVKQGIDLISQLVDLIKDVLDDIKGSSNVPG